MSAPELSRIVDVRQAEGKHMTITASEAERVALALRLGIVRIDRLEAEVTLRRKDRDVSAAGTLKARIVQLCAVSAEDLPVTISEPIAFRFVPAATTHAPEIDIEIDTDDCDEIEYDGTHIDVGEAVAQSLALAIDPFLTGPAAEAARERLRDQSASPFAVLLKRDSQ